MHHIKLNKGILGYVILMGVTVSLTEGQIRRSALDRDASSRERSSIAIEEAVLYSVETGEFSRRDDGTPVEFTGSLVADERTLDRTGTRELVFTGLDHVLVSDDGETIEFVPQSQLQGPTKNCELVVTVDQGTGVITFECRGSCTAPKTCKLQGVVVLAPLAGVGVKIRFECNCV